VVRWAARRSRMKTQSGTAALDPERALRIDPMNGREARESGLRPNGWVAPKHMRRHPFEKPHPHGVQSHIARRRHRAIEPNCALKEMAGHPRAACSLSTKNAGALLSHGPKVMDGGQPTRPRVLLARVAVERQVVPPPPTETFARGNGG
jgi:hypothetical protein